MPGVPLGKMKRGFMRDAVYSHLGASSPRILRGPQIGIDNAVVSLSETQVLIVTVDPVSVIPALGMRLSAWMSVHLIASDFTTSGHGPELATFSFNFPPELRTDEAETYVKSVGDECRKLGVSIVGGHTGSYPGAGFTVVGGGTMMGIAPSNGFIDSSMAREGDLILMTKSAAIEAVATLALSFPRFLERRVGIKATRALQGLISKCSTVKDAKIAASVGLGSGGVSAMHDATEGGVLGALLEMALASRKCFSVDLSKVAVPAEVAGACSAFGIDPMLSLAEGCLLITCDPDVADDLIHRLAVDGVKSAVIGSVKKGAGLLASAQGKKPVKIRPGPDPYWGAYTRAVRAKLE